MSEHTPGPWKAERVTKHEWRVNSDDYGEIVTLNAAYGVQAQSEMLEPDARLIAAAPDLLAACEAVIRDAHDNGEDSPVNQYRILDVVRAAIAKARGETA